MKKTIYITMSDGEVSKSILHSDIFNLLSEKVNVVFLVPKNKVNYFSSTLVRDGIFVEATPSAPSAFLEEIFSDLFLYSVPTESILIKIRHSYASGGSLLGKWIKMLLWSLGHVSLYRWFFRSVYRMVPDRSFDALFEKYPPDLVFAANLTSMEDARLLRAASRRGISTIGMPKGWDNLTLKTFVPMFSDRLLVQTPAMKEDAVRLDYPDGRIAIVGFPKFDVYADQSKKISREAFMEQFGFDAKRKLILYAGAGDQLAPHDEEILADLLAAIEKESIEGSPQVLVRPHPKYQYRSEILPKRNFWALDRPGTPIGKDAADFEFNKDDVLHLMHSLQHADVVIHTASTLGIEAAIFDKPVVALAYEGMDVPPDLSIARYYRYTHMRRAVGTGGMTVVRSFGELVRAVQEYLANPERDRAGRIALVRGNAHLIDGCAGKRVADEVLSMLDR